MVAYVFHEDQCGFFVPDPRFWPGARYDIECEHHTGGLCAIRNDRMFFKKTSVVLEIHPIALQSYRLGEGVWLCGDATIQAPT